MAEAKLPEHTSWESETFRELELTCMGDLLSTTEERVYFKDVRRRFLLVSAGWIAAISP